MSPSIPKKPSGIFSSGANLELQYFTEFLKSPVFHSLNYFFSLCSSQPCFISLVLIACISPKFLFIHLTSLFLCFWSNISVDFTVKILKALKKNQNIIWKKIYMPRARLFKVSEKTRNRMLFPSYIKCNFFCFPVFLVYLKSVIPINKIQTIANTKTYLNDVPSV